MVNAGNALDEDVIAAHSVTIFERARIILRAKEKREGNVNVRVSGFCSSSKRLDYAKK